MNVDAFVHERGTLLAAYRTGGIRETGRLPLYGIHVDDTHLRNLNKEDTIDSAEFTYNEYQNGQKWIMSTKFDPDDVQQMI